MNDTIAIVGAGVSGLATALALLKNNYRVKIYAKAITPHTTSDVAGAIWDPFKVGPAEQALAWALVSLEEFKKLAMTTPDSGVVFRMYTELNEVDTPLAPWMRYLEPISVPSYIPEKYQKYSHAMMIPLIDTQKYMPYLYHRVLAEGGEIEIKSIQSLEALLVTHPIVINCSGLGARELAQDETLYPIRGQVLSVKKIPNFEGCILRGQPLSHIFTRTHDCIIGGTVDESDWDLAPRAESLNMLLTGLREIYPDLQDQDIEVLSEKVGLRPGRAEVRLGVEGKIIHNYGHGGAGFTVSWGCAQEVVEFVKLLIV